MSKGDQTPRDRKRDSKKKNYENNGKYSAKHIRLKMNDQTNHIQLSQPNKPSQPHSTKSTKPITPKFN